jgi:hypothetical protein
MHSRAAFLMPIHFTLPYNGKIMHLVCIFALEVRAPLLSCNLLRAMPRSASMHTVHDYNHMQPPPHLSLHCLACSIFQCLVLQIDG